MRMVVVVVNNYHLENERWRVVGGGGDGRVPTTENERWRVVGGGGDGRVPTTENEHPGARFRWW
jgi:hypothetical protein